MNLPMSLLYTSFGGNCKKNKRALTSPLPRVNERDVVNICMTEVNFDQSKQKRIPLFKDMNLSAQGALINFVTLAMHMV